MIRVAIYFTPRPESDIAVAAAKWLGRDIFSQQYKNQLPPPGVSVDRFRELTASPFHYGFHGTLKPPFRLKPDRTISQLSESLEKFAEKRKVFILPEIALHNLGSFLCLMPTEPYPELFELAKKVVAEFDEFRLPIGAEELEKRRAAGLTDNQDLMFRTWGYPYVMEEFSFHLTLSGKIRDKEEREIITSYAQSLFDGEICRNIPFDGLSLFIEENKKPMLRIRFFAFDDR